ncbi:U3 small nucleolar RNA-associated protein 14 [Escovopsis weberi]|uniref:U3 small nucleolar RNA-associated protein 14 n=1 Tax=Escovopsis weberi TaxID=150374 RepID=A0A0M9VUM2_ESCWE|nr:U3 small nucleolar RNA-associated protein 14 [Escovopsis weberi]
MPGRQAHGRPLISQPKAKAAPKRSKARAQKTALNAFNIAQEQFPTKTKRTPRARELDAEIERKHARDEGDDDDDDDALDGDDAEDDEDRGPKRKKAKGPSRAAAGNDGIEYGSDSEGNEWRLGGLAEDDEDSEIESDEAFGESDNDMFQGYAFRGSRVQHRKDDDNGDDSDDSNDDQGATLGEEAIDLATALDQFEEESDAAPEGEGQEASGSDEDEDDDDDDDDEEEDDEESDDADDESDAEADPERLKELQGLISGFGGQTGDKDAESAAPRSQKISLGDLGLMGLSDPSMKRSIRLIKKEEKDRRPGASKKLDVPLSRREQGRLDRAAAYEKTNETLDRWTETVKANRRAEHLVFPLPQESESHGVDRNEIALVSAGSARNELESAILSIMEQSGLSMERRKKDKDGEEKKAEYDEEGNLLTRKQVLERKRMERELQSREAKRAKRIKKIKSKAYHRVHRKQRERDEMATQEARAEAGEIDSEEEREAHDRRRALERVGQRHKESKWAKMGSKNKRAVWDDDFRAGLTELARKDEELRRRKEGKGAAGGGGDGDDSDDTSSSGSSDDDDDGNGEYSDRKLRRQLDELEREDDDAPQSRLMGMKFMQKAEAAKKKANDELIRRIRRELDGEDADADADVADSAGEDKGDAGRRQYGVNTAAENPFAMPKGGALSRTKQKAQSQAQAHEAAAADDDDVAITTRRAEAQPTPAEATSSLAGAWSRGETRRKKHGRADDLALNDQILTATPASHPSSSSKPSKSKSASQPSSFPASDDEDQGGSHMPLAIRDQALVARAFAGEDVVADFQREKEQAASDDDDKVVDTTLPGWGSWVGDGVSAREKRRHQGRFLTKVEGIKKKDRKDAKLERVIINEKRVKKNDKFLASQLPHMFESRQQYERSLRLPVGPEWMTKESFQDSTRPRVLIKQGVIAPISRPTA